jgi:hypothetical protein
VGNNSAAYGWRFDRNKRRNFLRFQWLRVSIERLGSQFDLLNLPSGDAGLIADSVQCQTAETLKAAFDVLTLVAFEMVERQPNLRP